jgi:hypothetical protein
MIPRVTGTTTIKKTAVYLHPEKEAMKICIERGQKRK